MTENMRITPVCNRLAVKVIEEVGTMLKAEVIALSTSVEELCEISVGSIIFVGKFQGHEFGGCFRIIEADEVLAVVEELVEKEGS